MAYWTPKDYTPYFLYQEPTHTPQEIRAEYTRVRDILVKRAKRLRNAGFEGRAEYIEKNISLDFIFSSYASRRNHIQ